MSVSCRAAKGAGSAYAESGGLFTYGLKNNPSVSCADTSPYTGEAKEIGIRSPCGELRSNSRTGEAYRCTASPGRGGSYRQMPRFRHLQNCFSLFIKQFSSIPAQPSPSRPHGDLPYQDFLAPSLPSPRTCHAAPLDKYAVPQELHD